MQRPLGVTLLALLNILGGALFIFSGISMLFMGKAMYAGVVGGTHKIVAQHLMGITVLAFGLLGVAIGYGLWKLKEWARIIYLIILAIGILFSFLMIIYGFKSYGGYLIIYAIIVWYLTRPHVKEAFS